ncbi:hypothetical protein E4T56_gene5471 [Termitomyces sp. T112]|nr:hypothetical protein E4T56_gene5471 [Termitomyces sp. T112]
MDLHKTDPPTLTSTPLVSMPLHPIPTPRSPCNSPRVLECPNHSSLPTILIPHPLQCLIPLLMPIILDPPPLEDPLGRPWGLPRAMRVNPPVEGHPTADPLGNGARQWTTSPPSVETRTTTITTTMPDPRSELKIHRTIPTMHWPRRCLTMFQAKPITFELESSRVAFAASYLQATLLHATILTPDSPPVHLPSHSSNNLLLHTTLPFTANPVPTLVDSSTTDNFIDEFLAALAPHFLQCLPTLIPLKLFDGDPTPVGDITHCLEMTMTLANGRQQELQLLITKLHPSTPIILGFSWLCSTNPHVNWPSLTLRLNRDNPTNSGLVPFNVSPSSENSKTTIDHPRTPPQVFPALVNSGASGTVVSNQLGLWHNNLDKPLELQLFNGSPTMTRITQ